MQIETTVKIPATRYIELLEIEIKMLKQPKTKPLTSSACKLHEATRRIHDDGNTIRQWARENGFKAPNVRAVICGNRKTQDIVDALVRDGFMEAA